MTDTRKKMLGRVRALLAKNMENGCTEGEAMAVFEKARELMGAYEINESDIIPETERARILAASKADPYRIKDFLSVRVAAFTRCRAWRSNAGVIYFCGLSSDVEFAGWLLETLGSFVLRELQIFLRRRKAEGLRSPRLISTSFVRGATTRINARIRELTPQEQTGRGLVVSRNAQIDEVMSENGIKLKDRTSRISAVNTDAFSAGKLVGDAARFDRPVGSRADSDYQAISSRNL